MMQLVLYSMLSGPEVHHEINCFFKESNTVCTFCWTFCNNRYAHFSASHTETKDVSAATHCMHSSLTSLCLWSRTDSAGQISLKCFNIPSFVSHEADVTDNIHSSYSEWLDHALPEPALRVLICLRLLIRDPHHQVQFKQCFLSCIL